jgi:hypothetical protein
VLEMCREWHFAVACGPSAFSLRPLTLSISYFHAIISVSAFLAQVQIRRRFEIISPCMFARSMVSLKNTWSE